MTAETPAVPNPLTPLDEDWQRGLAIVAHPDDLEFGAAAAVARWTRQGKEIVYCLLTSGEAGIDGMTPEEAGPLREEEQRTSARIVGVSQVDFLGLPDGVIEYGVPLRRELSKVIRTYRPEIVITNNFRDSWDPAGAALNMADHINTGRATLDAVRDAANRWVFRDQLTDGLEKWGGVKQVWASGSPQSQARGRHHRDVRTRRPVTGGARARTCAASARATSTRRSSWRASRGRPAPGWA